MNYWMSHPTHLDSFLTGLSRPPKSDIAKLLRMVMVGTGEKDGQGFIEAMEREGYAVSDCAKEILQCTFPPNMCIPDVFKQVWLALVTPKELGFTEPALKADICKKAVHDGLSLCTAEIGPQLRLQYPNQKVGEELLIGMHCCMLQNGEQGFFIVKHSPLNQELKCASGEELYDVESTWVFVHPKGA
jgi:hypothetical protein